MSTTEFIKVSLYLLLTGLSATSLGFGLINLIRKRERKEISKERMGLETIGASLLLGMGIFGYLFFIIGIAGIFTKSLLIIAVSLCLILSVRNTILLLEALAKNIRSLFRYLFKNTFKNFLAVISIAISILAVGTLYLTSMQPPYTTDELAYHLPEALQMVNSHRIDINFGGHPFYGNLPKLMEIIFAYGKAVSSFQLSHALNFAIFVGLLMVIFGVIKKYYGTTAASLSVLLLTFFDDFTWNATVAHVDAAASAFEISAFLFILNWSKERDGLSFFLSAFFIGLALSVKYSPIPTAVFILVFVIFFLIRRHRKNLKAIIKKTTTFLLAAIAIGGFWYIKNLIIHKNPFYPLYFGHEGYPEDQYLSLINAIQQFGPKTFPNFFNLTKYYLSLTQFPIFASIYLSPIILLLRKRNPFRFSLFICFIFYTAYWFYFATHQIRFLATPLVISTIILAILISRIKQRVIFAMLGFIAISTVVFSKTIKHIPYQEAFINFWNTKLHFVESQYALGNISQTEFLRKQFGCQYLVLRYLQDNNLQGNVIDNWSVWFAPNLSLYTNINKFMPFPYGNANPTEIEAYLKTNNLKYLYYDTVSQKLFFKSTDPVIIKNRDAKIPAEKYLLKNAKLIYQKDTCFLFKLANN